MLPWCHGAGHHSWRLKSDFKVELNTTLAHYRTTAHQ